MSWDEEYDIDPMMESLFLGQLQPKYSATRGWQPVDSSTMSQQATVMKKYMELMGDPFLAAGNNAGLNPQMFEDDVTYEESEPAPGTPLMALYGSRPDSLEGKIALAIAKGATYQEAVRAAMEDPELVDFFKTPGVNGPDPKKVDQLMSLGEQFQSEWLTNETAVAQGAGADPKEIRKPSQARQMFEGMGFSAMPGEQYGAQDFMDPSSMGDAQMLQGALPNVEALQAQFLQGRDQRQNMQGSLRSMERTLLDNARPSFLDEGNEGRGLRDKEQRGELASNMAHMTKNFRPQVQKAERQNAQDRERYWKELKPVSQASARLGAENARGKARAIVATRQGRTPFFDEFLSRQRGLDSRGYGA